MKDAEKTGKETRARKSRNKDVSDNKDTSSFKVPLPKSGQTRRDSTAPQNKAESSATAKAGKSAHRRASSVSSTGRKPRSASIDAVAKSQSIKRPVTPDDDAVSVAESCKSKSGRTRRSEAERIRYLQNDPNCGDIEPFRAFCKKCRKRLSLGRRTTYSLDLWLRHRRSCDRNTADANPNEENSSADERDNVATSSPPPPVPPSEDSELTDVQLRAILKADPRAEVVEPHRMRCKKCRKWVKLGTKQRYGGLSQWLIHQMRCHHSLQGSDAADSARAAMVQALRLAKDAQVSTFTFTTVECAACGERVSLEPGGDYDMTRWEEHRLTCPKIEDGSPQPPPSSGSASPVPSDAEAAVRIGKRRRDGNDAETETAPARNRPKKEVTESALGWILHPFRMFVRGFREGMQASASS